MATKLALGAGMQSPTGFFFVQLCNLFELSLLITGRGDPSVETSLHRYIFTASTSPRLAVQRYFFSSSAFIF